MKTVYVVSLSFCIGVIKVSLLSICLFLSVLLLSRNNTLSGICKSHLHKTYLFDIAVSIHLQHPFQLLSCDVGGQVSYIESMAPVLWNLKQYEYRIVKKINIGYHDFFAFKLNSICNEYIFSDNSKENYSISLCS